MATPKGGVSSNVSDEEFLPITNVSGIDPLLWPPQEQGQFALDQNLTDFLGCCFNLLLSILIQAIAET